MLRIATRVLILAALSLFAVAPAQADDACSVQGRYVFLSVGPQMRYHFDFEPQECSPAPAPVTLTRVFPTTNPMPKPQMLTYTVDGSMVTVWNAGRVFFRCEIVDDWDTIATQLMCNLTFNGPALRRGPVPD